MENILTIEGVKKSFGELRALDDVSLRVKEKSVTILIGPNGSGKTTLINVISGFYKPDSGRVLLGEKNITGLPPHKIYKLGVARTFQIPALFTKLTLLENMLVAARDNPGEGLLKSLRRASWEHAEEEEVKRAYGILTELGLSKICDITASKISGGQMKLLEVGRALMSGANLILLDEPVSGVNPTLAHDIFSKLLKLRSTMGVTFFLVEHRLEIALSYVDEVVAMAYGKFLAAGKPQVVLSNPAVVDAYLGG